MKAVMYGGGNIGRGFIGELLCRSGFETVFIDVNMPLVDALNKNGGYPLYLTGADGYRRVGITGVRAVDGRDTAAVAAEISDADVMFTAVGANILPFIAANIAAGFEKRLADGGAPLNIVVCENLMDADKLLRGYVNAGLSRDALAYTDAQIGFAEASVGRMVPLPPKEIADGDMTAVCAEPYYELPVDADALVSPIDTLTAVAGIKPCRPFDFYIRRKLFLHNMAHAATAYLGSLKGYTYIYEAIADVEIRANTAAALAEASAAMTAEFGSSTPDASPKSLAAYCSDILDRFGNVLLGDTVERVGRDTERKLAAADRLTGAYLLCRSHGIDAPALVRAIAAAFRFTADAKSAAVEAYVKINGIPLGMFRYAGVTDMAICAQVQREYNGMAKKI